jgi:hypothetical protein
MIDDADRTAEDEFGPWAWIAGLILAAAIVAVMFTFATGRF